MSSSPITPSSTIAVVLSPGNSAKTTLYVSFGAAQPTQAQASFNRTWEGGVAAGTLVNVSLPAGVSAGVVLQVHSRVVTPTGAVDGASKNLTVEGECVRARVRPSTLQPLRRPHALTLASAQPSTRCPPSRPRRR